MIIDGTDNFPTRYLMSDASLMARKPLVHASILRFEGHASTFLPVRRPLLPLPLPGAAAAGHGALVRRGRRARRALRRDGQHHGHRGDQGARSASATRSSGRLLIYDALDMTFTELKIRRDPDCPACGPNAAARVPRLRRLVRRRRSPLRGGRGRMSMVRIPPVLRQATGGEREIEVAGSTVSEVLDALYDRTPACARSCRRPRATCTASSTSTSTTRTCGCWAGSTPRWPRATRC